jgi:hypothetical protein
MTTMSMNTNAYTTPSHRDVGHSASVCELVPGTVVFCLAVTHKIQREYLHL